MMWQFIHKQKRVLHHGISIFGQQVRHESKDCVMNHQQISSHVRCTFLQITPSSFENTYIVSQISQPIALLIAHSFAADAQHVNVLPSPPHPASSSHSPTPIQATSSYRPLIGPSLQRYGRDLTDDAAQGRLDPLLGRNDVIEATLQILLRRTKNNPILIGDPGVGKTAIVEGIAQVAVSPAAPRALRGKAIVSLDLGAVVAGTQYRGAFEERLQGILGDIRAASGQIILFIDEIHMLMDAGRVEGGMNAANLLKPALSRGELHCIGATTVEEYRKHIEKDGAFARRLQPVMVEEPTPDVALHWLRGLQGRYEQHHQVCFTEDALRAAVHAAHRYIPDRRLPDSAIDLLDEAASRAQLQEASTDFVLNAWQQQQQQWINQTNSDDDTTFESNQHQSHMHSVPSTRPAYYAATQGHRSPEETRKLLEWFGAAPEDPLPGFAGHQQTAEARRQKFLDQYGQGMYTSPMPSKSTQYSNIDADARAMKEPGGSSLPCPHCGTPSKPRVLDSKTVVCPACNFKFLNISPQKLLLGASLFLDKGKERWPAARDMHHANVDMPSDAAHHEQQQQQHHSTVGKEHKQVGGNYGDIALRSSWPRVDSMHIFHIIAGKAGIPLDHIMQLHSNWELLHTIEPSLFEYIIGQDHAVHAVSSVLRRAIALGNQQQNGNPLCRRRPVASLLLNGPPGVGKSTLCRAMAKTLYASDRAFLRFDLSQCTDKTGVSKLVGAPPGFIGHGEGGELTDALRRRPHSVILFDEVDKAHIDVLSLLREILQEGELRDSMGKRVDFRNAVVVLSSSSATRSLSRPFAGSNDGAGESKADSAAVEDRAHIGTKQSAHAIELPLSDREPKGASAAVHKKKVWIVPEDLSSALDATIDMPPLGKDDLVKIAKRHFVGDTIIGAFAEQGMALEVTDDALMVAAEHAGVSGAGAMHAVVRNLILTSAVDAMIEHKSRRVAETSDGGHAFMGMILVDVDDTTKQTLTVKCI